MIFIDDITYAELATRLFSKLENGQEYYNGKVEYDKDRYDSFLTCSLMIYHNKLSGTARNDRSIEKIVPVWWDFSLSAEGRAQAHDFCWSYFSTFFPFA